MHFPNGTIVKCQIIFELCKKITNNKPFETRIQACSSEEPTFSFIADPTTMLRYIEMFEQANSFLMIGPMTQKSSLVPGFLASLLPRLVAPQLYRLQQWPPQL